MRKKKKKRKPPPQKPQKTHLKVGPTEVACRSGGLAAKGRGWTCSRDVADVTCAGCRGTPRFRFALAQPREHLLLTGIRPKAIPAAPVDPSVRMQPLLWAILRARAAREGISAGALVHRACRRYLATPVTETDAAPDATTS